MKNIVYLFRNFQFVYFRIVFVPVILFSHDALFASHNSSSSKTVTLNHSIYLVKQNFSISLKKKQCMIFLISRKNIILDFYFFYNQTHKTDFIIVLFVSVKKLLFIIRVAREECVFRIFKRGRILHYLASFFLQYFFEMIKLCKVNRIYFDTHICLVVHFYTF